MGKLEKRKKGTTVDYIKRQEKTLILVEFPLGQGTTHRRKKKGPGKG